MPNFAAHLDGAIHSNNSAVVSSETKLVPFDAKLLDKLCMPKNEIRILDPEEYARMSKVQKHTTSNEEQQTMKLTLMSKVKNAYGDKWFRLKSETKKAIDRLAFLAAEKGFAFPSDDTLADMYGISPRTVREFLRFLKEEGVIYVVHFRAKNGNGRRGHVMLFMNHPYFERWANLLNLSFECQTDCQQENVEIPCGSKDETGKKIPTLSLPLFFKQEKDNQNDLGKIVKFVSLKLKDNPKKISHLSSYVDRVLNNLHTDSVYTDPEYLKLKNEYHDRLRTRTVQKQQNAPKRPTYNWLDVESI
jgi:hypothetical protein